MHDGLKQRLIGAVVLLALAVIFVPVMFDREQLQPIDRDTQIPTAPDIEPIVVPEPEVPPSVEAAPPVEEMFLPEEPRQAEKRQERHAEKQQEVAPPSLNEQGVPNAWVLQVASYQSAERAEEMKKALVDEGYKAFTRKVQAQQGEMTRLFVGPKLEQEKLRQDQAAIEEKYQVSTFILKFAP